MECSNGHYLFAFWWEQIWTIRFEIVLLKFWTILDFGNSFFFHFQASSTQTSNVVAKDLLLLLRTWLFARMPQSQELSLFSFLLNFQGLIMLMSTYFVRKYVCFCNPIFICHALMICGLLFQIICGAQTRCPCSFELILACLRKITIEMELGLGFQALFLWIINLVLGWATIGVVEVLVFLVLSRYGGIFWETLSPSFWTLWAESSHVLSPTSSLILVSISLILSLQLLNDLKKGVHCRGDETCLPVPLWIPNNVVHDLV